MNYSPLIFVPIIAVALGVTIAAILLLKLHEQSGLFFLAIPIIIVPLFLCMAGSIAAGMELAEDRLKNRDKEYKKLAQKWTQQWQHRQVSFIMGEFGGYVMMNLNFLNQGQEMQQHGGYGQQFGMQPKVAIIQPGVGFGAGGQGQNLNGNINPVPVHIISNSNQNQRQNYQGNNFAKNKDES